MIYLSRSARNMLLAVFPDFLPNLYAAPASPQGVNNHCNIPQQHVRIVENVHSFKQVKSYLENGYLGNGWEPVLFKKYLSDPEKKWESVVQKHKDDGLLFSEVEVLSFGNIFLPGIRAYGKVESTLADAVARATHPGNRSFFASFLPFLDPESSKLILGMTDEEYKSILIDTNFVSNFKSTVLATAVHSAVPPNSYGIQLMGRKLWVFVPPSEMESFDAINVGPTILFSGSEADMVRASKRYIIAVQEEGDLLFFPPQWGHAVVTKSGVNVMCNVREMAVGKSLLTYPRKVLEGLFAKAYLDGFSAPFNHARMNTAQLKMKSFIEQIYRDDKDFLPPESGCKDKWIEMLHR